MSVMSIDTISENRAFGGVQGIYSHHAQTLDCDMRVSVFVPPQAESGPRPVLFWLSGLTCTEENFTVKAGAQRLAAEYGLIVVAPDTSPRGDGVADDDAYDFGPYRDSDPNQHYANTNSLRIGFAFFS